MSSGSPPASSGAQPNASPRVRTVDAGRGATWWSEAWRLFTPSAGVWILAVVILFVLALVLQLVPFIGHIVLQVLNPVLLGGLMLGCRELDRGGKLKLEHAFAGFSQRFAPLLTVGIIYTLAAIAIALLVFGILLMLFGATIVAQLWNLQDPSEASYALGSLLLAVLVGLMLFLLLIVPLAMAVWFAPALVVLKGVEPLAAMRLSFAGCLRNFLPFLVYSAIGVALAILASIPFLLGWLVLAPVTVATIYTAYRDIYDDVPVAALPAAAGLPAGPPTPPL